MNHLPSHIMTQQILAIADAEYGPLSPLSVGRRLYLKTIIQMLMVYNPKVSAHQLFFMVDLTAGPELLDNLYEVLYSICNHAHSEEPVT